MATYRHPVTINYPGSGGPGLNVWHLRTTGDGVPSAGELEGLSTVIRDFYTACRVIFPGSVTITYQGVSTTVGDDPQYDSSAPAWTVTGSGPTTLLSPLLCICVGWLTSSASRSGRGRTFLGPLTTGVQGPDGTITDTNLAVVRAAATALATASGGFADGAIGVWSPTDGLLRDIVGSATRDQFAYLSSRRD